MNILGQITLLILFIPQKTICARVVEHLGPSEATSFRLRALHESSRPMTIIRELQGGTTSLHNCQRNCADQHNCLSFNYKATMINNTCQLFDDIDATPTRSEVKSAIYGEALNRRGIPFDCVSSHWTEWSSIAMWDYCGLTNASALQCNSSCEQNSTALIAEPSAYGGAECQTYKKRLCENANLTHILLIAGSNSSGPTKTILHFTPETKQVTPLTLELAQARGAHTAVFYGQQIIVDGGLASTNNLLTSTEFLEGVPLHKISTSSSYVSHLRQHGCSAIMDDRLYQCFGRSADSAAGPYMSHCDVYDLKNNYAHSQLITDMPRIGLAGWVQQDNYLYVIGGVNENAHQNAVYRLNLSNGVTSSLSNYPYRLYGHSAVWFRGNIIVCGGHTPVAPNFRNHCYEYMISDDSWVPFPAMTVPRMSFHLVDWGNDKLLALGGYTVGWTQLDSIELFDGGSWVSYAQLPYELGGSASVVVKP